MDGLLPLMRVQLLGFANSLAPANKFSNKTQRYQRFALWATGMLVLYACAAWYMFTQAEGLALAGFASVIPGLAVFLASVFGFALTFLKANGTLFGAKDFDAVMSLPVSHRAVVITRMLSLVCYAEVLALLTLPALLVYFMHVPTAAAGIILSVLIVMLAPLAPTVVAILLSYLIAFISARFRHSNLIFIALSLIALCCIVFGAMTLSFSATYSGADPAFMLLPGLGNLLEQTIGYIYPPAIWAAQSISNQNYLAFIGFALLSIVVLVLAIEIIQRSYMSMNDALSARTYGAHIDSKTIAQTASRAHSAFWALVFKEWRALIGIPSYAFNCVFGYLFTIIVAIIAATGGVGDFLSSSSELDGNMLLTMLEPFQLLIPWVFAFCFGMCYSSVMSISLEGRNSWLVSSFPLSTRQIVLAKFASNAIPAGVTLLIVVVIMLASNTITPLIALEVLFVASGSFVFWISIGMHFDIRKPNLSWISPQDVIKRSIPSFIIGFGETTCTLICGGLTVAGAFLLGLEIMHALLFVIALVMISCGIAILEHAIRKTPALFW